MVACHSLAESLEQSMAIGCNAGGGATSGGEVFYKVRLLLAITRGLTESLRPKTVRTWTPSINAT